MSYVVDIDAHQARRLRDKLLKALEQKTSWGRNELHRLIDNKFMEVLEEEIAKERAV